MATAEQVKSRATARRKQLQNVLSDEAVQALMAQLFECIMERLEAMPQQAKPKAKTKARTAKKSAAKFENPSPSGDPYFANPKNVAGLRERIRLNEEDEQNGITGVTLNTPEEALAYFDAL